MKTPPSLPWSLFAALLPALLPGPAPVRAATLPNAWQIADVSTTGGVLNYFTNLTAAQHLAATNAGWRFTVVSRLVEGSGGAGPAHFMNYGHDTRRFAVSWDTDAAGRLTATAFGTPNTTHIVTTNASAATNAYHRHELVYDPLTRQATYRFDGASIQTWTGLTDTNQSGTSQWGSASGGGKGRMNYHQARFTINGLGTVAEYDAGLQAAPALAPNPQAQGWNTNLPTGVAGVTNAPVSPDLAPLPTLNATYITGGEVPVTSDGFRATGYTVNFTLKHAPVTGTELMVVRNTGLGFMQGEFDNLTNGQPVTLSYSGTNYNFVANYFGGSGNDLVLAWAEVRPVGWGENEYGQLGNGSNALGVIDPVAVNRSGVLSNKTVMALAAGNSHSLALCSDGTLAAWGFNCYYALGNNRFLYATNEPVAVNRSAVLSNKTVAAIAAGRFHNLALCADGTLAAWGRNYEGQLGNGSGVCCTNVPVAVTTNTGALSNKTVVAIAAGGDHNLVLCSDGTLAAWGMNNFGQLGDCSLGNRSNAVLVYRSGVLSNKTVVATAAGAFHSLALCSDGTLAAWGGNSLGQLGDGTTNNRCAAVLVDRSGVLSNKMVVAIAAGYAHSLALCSDGSLAAWGDNILYQLGNNSSVYATNDPVAVNRSGVLSNKTVAAIVASAGHNLALCADGSLAAWGLNSDGQLGNSSMVSTNLPVAVSMTSLAAGERFSHVAGGSHAYHTLALVAAPPAFAQLTLLSQPQSTNVPAGSNVTLRVTAAGPLPIAYQWQFNGADLPNQTNAALSLTNLQFHPHTGYYRVRVSDPASNVWSDTATLLVLQRPVITNQPAAQTVLQGGTAVFSVTGGPDHPLLPLSYRWLRNGVLWASNAPPILVITNCQTNGSFGCELLNAVGNAASIMAGLTVLPDFDGDGMADAWERQHGFDTNSLADATQDFDGDGMSNRDEYRAGTNPTNAASVLKLQFRPVVAGPVALSFLAISNRTYTVEWNPEAAAGAWNRLQDVLALPADRLESVDDTNASGAMRLYRVVTPKRP